MIFLFKNKIYALRYTHLLHCYSSLNFNANKKYFGLFRFTALRFVLLFINISTVKWPSVHVVTRKVHFIHYRMN